MSVGDVDEERKMYDGSGMKINETSKQTSSIYTFFGSPKLKVAH